MFVGFTYCCRYKFNLANHDFSLGIITQIICSSGKTTRIGFGFNCIIEIVFKSVNYSESDEK